MINEQLFHVTTKDNASIALWELCPETPLNKHILLIHGTFSDRKICDGIGKHFAKKGYTCWLMEWRNHGLSSKTKHKFNFETIAKQDLVAVSNFLFNTEGITNLDVITHSGGGIILTMFLVNNPKYRSKINSITFFGTQVFGAAYNLVQRIKITVGKYATAMLGTLPFRTLGLMQHNETYYTMKQWFNWNLHTNFLGDTGFDYKPKMADIDIPILSVCAKGDTFIAPKQGCESFLNAFKNPLNQLLYLSKANGNLENYNHSRMLKSQNAKKEVWPVVEQWIEKG